MSGGTKGRTQKTRPAAGQAVDVSWTEAVALGVVQGLTEFLPVSSSGHLVLAQHLLGIREPQLVFDIAVHLGTLAAVPWAMRQEVAEVARGLWLWPRALQGRLARPEDGAAARLAAWVALGTVPAALVGLLLNEPIEALFGSPRAVAVALALTGLLLWMAPVRPAGAVDLHGCGPACALAVGVAQALAVVPGISRSGATVTAGLWCGLNGADAARFSFLLSVPTILGAAVLGVFKASTGQLAAPPAGVVAVGVLAAALTGYGAIAMLLDVLRRRRLRWFSLYLWVLAAVAWAFM